jgi:hypothetical protein
MPYLARAQAQDKIKIGFHSALTGLETILGETQLNCFKLAVDEVNAAGGAGGREIEYLVEDNQTTTTGAIDKTRKFIMEDNVDVIIGMITSLERAAALSVSVPAKKLVIYPTYYEGGECQRYLACTGQIPNQSSALTMPGHKKPPRRFLRPLPSVAEPRWAPSFSRLAHRISARRWTASARPNRMWCGSCSQAPMR